MVLQSLYFILITLEMFENKNNSSKSSFIRISKLVLVEGEYQPLSLCEF